LNISYSVIERPAGTHRNLLLARSSSRHLALHDRANAYGHSPINRQVRLLVGHDDRGTIPDRHLRVR